MENIRELLNKVCTLYLASDNEEIVRVIEMNKNLLKRYSNYIDRFHGEIKNMNQSENHSPEYHELGFNDDIKSINFEWQMNASLLDWYKEIGYEEYIERKTIELEQIGNEAMLVKSYLRSLLLMNECESIANELKL